MAMEEPGTMHALTQCLFGVRPARRPRRDKRCLGTQDQVRRAPLWPVPGNKDRSWPREEIRPRTLFLVELESPCSRPLLLCIHLGIGVEYLLGSPIAGILASRSHARSIPQQCPARVLGSDNVP